MAVLINEVATRGPGNPVTAQPAELDEFVELFNNGGAPVDISGWQLQVVPNFLGTPVTIATVPAGTPAIPVGGRFVFVNAVGFTGTIPPGVPQQGYAADIPDDHGIQLVTAAGVKVDSVGFRSAAINAATETKPASRQTPDTDECALSNQRLECGTGAECVDTDNNSADFRSGRAPPARPTCAESPAVTSAGGARRYSYSPGSLVGSATPLTRRMRSRRRERNCQMLGRPLAISRSPRAVTASPCGRYSSASVAGPPSPE